LSLIQEACTGITRWEEKGKFRRQVWKAAVVTLQGGEGILGASLGWILLPLLPVLFCRTASWPVLEVRIWLVSVLIFIISDVGNLTRAFRGESSPGEKLL